MIKPPLVTFCSILGLFTLGSVDSTYAGSGRSTGAHSVQGVADREIARREESMVRAAEAVALGDRAYKSADFDMAYQQYLLAADLLTDCPNTRGLRQSAVSRLCDAAVKLSKQRISEGRFADAKTIIEKVLADRYAPGFREGLVLLRHIEDPDYFNHTMTPKFHANVEQVKKWLIEAKQFYDTGRYDMAFKRYEQVLNVDPYNTAARKGQETVNTARSDYAIQAYDETRSRAIWKLEKAWENPVRKYGVTQGGTIDQGPVGPGGVARISQKLSRIIVPKVEFKDATVREAIDFLKARSKELDTTETDPAQKGVNIVLQLTEAGSMSAPAPAPAAAAPAAAPAVAGIPGLEPAAPAPGAPAAAAPAAAAPSINPSEAHVTLSLSNVPLMEVLKYITSLSGLKVKIDPYAVSIVPLSVVTDQLITKEFKVPPGFLSSKSSGEGATSMAASSGPKGGAGAAGNASTIAVRQSAKEYLEQSGVAFPQGASANFIPSSSRLIIKNTQDNLDLIETIVESTLNDVPKQVEIEAKFVEITQNNLKELSFDWLLGQFNIGGNKVFSSGGTSGNGKTVSTSDYSFTEPGSTTPVGTNSVTSGNRTGSGASGAISANAIDALLFPTAVGSTSTTPSVFSVAGVFTDPQFQVAIRALNQKKGVDLLSAPRVTTKSGQRATIEIIREFRYPTQFNPPQIPTSIGSTGGSSLTGGSSKTTIPITPTTPTEFETRNTGVTLEVEPVIGPDGATIDLNLVPQVVEFEGFINYGSPIMSEASPSTLDSVTGLFTAAQAATVLTANTINQPIFSTRKVTTSVSVWDNSTVVIGGLMREDVQKVEDKVPFLGDIPLFGRLFRSSVDQHLKRNLVIFVSARLINPAGDPLVQEEEKEEAVESLIPTGGAPGALPELAPAPLPSAK